MNILSLEEEKDRKRARNWKKLTPHQKHITLMYFYRLKTDFGHIMDYYESWIFLRMQVDPNDLPTYLATMKPRDLRLEAYEVIGKLNELPREPA